MDNLRDRFATLDRVPMPDLWTDVEQRAARLRSAERFTPVTVRTPVRSLGRRDRSPALLAAAALLVALLAGAVAIGSGLVRLPAILPVPTVSPSPDSFLTPAPTGTPTREPTPSNTPVVGPNGLVAYSVCTRLDPQDLASCAGDLRIWVVNADGTGAHELRPNERGSQHPIAWSPDGSKLLYSSDEWGDDLAMTDASGAPPEILPNESLCPAELGDCRAQVSRATFSPDGRRLAYAIFADPDASTEILCRDGIACWGDGYIAVLDIATGLVTKLDASLIPGPYQCCDGYYAPSWSADGTRLAFAMRSLTGFTIDVDGSDLRQLTPPGQAATAPLWSPDGSALTSEIGGGEPAIYLVQPDGGNFRPVAHNAWDSHWTHDGRIVFSRQVGDQPVSNWIIDADGGNERPLDDTIPALTAAGCMVCPYRDEDGYVTGVALWQPVPAAEPTPSNTPVVGPNGLVAYPVCTSGGYPGPQTCRLWVANSDGTGAHELIPYEPNPDALDWQQAYEFQFPLAWSPDGSRLLFSFSRVEYSGPQDGIGTVHTGLALTNDVGSEPQEFESVCPEPGVETDQYNSCDLRLNDRPIITFSPDGTRVAYVIYEDWGGGDSEVDASALAILDLSTGAVTRLDSTQADNYTLTCTTARHHGHNSSPAWSPDGTRLAFMRSDIGPPEDGNCQNGLFTVDVETGGVDQLVTSGLPIGEPTWSPDSSSLLFHAFNFVDGRGRDIYAIRQDGSGPQALTSDGSSTWPHLSRDGRIIFLRYDAVWTMDADGGNASQLDSTIPALTAAGCVVCPYPVGNQDFFDDNGLNVLLWQPVQEDQL